MSSFPLLPKNNTAYLQYLVDTYGPAIDEYRKREREDKMTKWPSAIDCPNCGATITTIEYKNGRLERMPARLVTNHLPSYERGGARIEYGEQVFNRGRTGGRTEAAKRARANNLRDGV